MMVVKMSNKQGWRHEVNPMKADLIKKYVQSGKALDLGAGMGWYSRMLKDQGMEVSTLDLEVQFNEEGIRSIEGSLEEKMPFLDDEFNLILAWDIVEHVKNEPLVLNEIDRVLKKGGKLLLSVPHGDDSVISTSYLTFCHFKDKTHCREYLPADLEQIAKSRQWEVELLKLDGGNSYPYIILNFIDNQFIKFLTKAYIWLLLKLKIMKLKNCHGDIYFVAEKK